jgi:hypothetical protein
MTKQIFTFLIIFSLMIASMAIRKSHSLSQSEADTEFDCVDKTACELGCDLTLGYEECVKHTYKVAGIKICDYYKCEETS